MARASVSLVMPMEDQVVSRVLLDTLLSSSAYLLLMPNSLTPADGASWRTTSCSTSCVTLTYIANYGVVSTFGRNFSTPVTTAWSTSPLSMRMVSMRARKLPSWTHNPKASVTSSP